MAAKKTATKAKTAAKKTATAAPAAKKSAAKKSAAKKSPAKAPATKKSTAKAATKKSTVKKVTTKKPAAKKATKASTAAKAARLVVREDESPWTAAELKEVRADLNAEIERLRAEIASSETELTAFLREPIDGAGDDQADAGAKSFEREHELSLVAGARTGLEQNLHALERLEDGSYGICESCGNPIGKLRLQAYPRATLCMTCKSKQERR